MNIVIPYTFVLRVAVGEGIVATIAIVAYLLRRKDQA